MTLDEAKQVLRDFRALLQKYPRTSYHVQCGAMPDTCLSVPVPTYDEELNTLWLPDAYYANVQTAWTTFTAANPGMIGDPFAGSIGTAVDVLNAALPPNRTGLYVLLGLGAAAGVAGLVYSATRK